MRNFTYGELGLYFALTIITISEFIIPKNLVRIFVWISLCAALLWIVLELYDHITKVRYIKYVKVPYRVIKMNSTIRGISLGLMAVYAFCWLFITTPLWMGYLYWLSLGALIASRIMVSIDWYSKDDKELNR